MQKYRIKPTAERFWQKVKKTPTCWLWTGGKFVNGYGMFTSEYSTKKAHRIAWELTKGPIPDGMFVLHKCDVHNCVNPEHLWLGNHSDNMRDCTLKGRKCRGEDQWESKLTPQRVKLILGLRDEGFKVRVIADLFQVHPHTIENVIYGKNWTHLTNEVKKLT